MILTKNNVFVYLVRLARHIPKQDNQVPERTFSVGAFDLVCCVCHDGELIEHGRLGGAPLPVEDRYLNKGGVSQRTIVANEYINRTIYC